MKKNTRRLVAICLTVVLILSMAVAASAASTAFTYSGETYYAVLTRGSSRSDKLVAIPNGDQGEHISGGQDTPIYTSGLSVNLTHAVSIPLAFYSSYLRTLLTREGLYESWTARESIGENWIYVDPSLPSGTYQWAVSFYAYNAYWEVESDIGINSVNASGTHSNHSGTISKAPTGTWVYDVVKVS